MSDQVRISLSKTNYTGTQYSATVVDIDPTEDNIRVTFPVTYLNFERGQRVYLDKPANSDWSGEYYIQLVDHTLGFTVIHLRWRAGDIVQSTPALPATGTITEHEFDWTIYKSVLSDGVIKQEREEGFIFFRKKLNRPVTIINDAYTFINGLREECDPYLIYIKIERVCDHEWVEEYLGAFTVNDIKWDLTKCVAEINPYTFDQYFAYFKLFREENNIMEIATRYQAESGSLQLGDKWIKIEDLLEFFIGLNMYNVKSIQSDFFNINPVGYSYPAVIDISDMENVMISAVSDVLIPGATDPTAEVNYTFFQFLDNLRVVFGVYWNVVNGVFILENEYYFSSAAGLDITNKVLNRKNEFEIDVDKIPRQETFKFAQGYYTDFIESTIVYNDEILSNQKDGGQRRTYVANGLMTDSLWAYNVSVGASISQRPSEENMIIIGAFSPTVNGVTGSYPKVADLTWHYLIQRFHQYFRPRITGYYYQTTVGRVVNTFESTRKVMLRKDIMIKLCCEDFDPADYLTTEYGQAEVKSVEHNVYRGTATLNLLFEIPC